MGIDSEIKKLKKEIAEAKQEKAESVGALKELMTRLKNEFNLNSLSETKEKLKVWERKNKELKEQRDKLFSELKENFEW